jgi:hypothetical protein
VLRQRAVQSVLDAARVHVAYNLTIIGLVIVMLIGAAEANLGSFRR